MIIPKMLINTVANKLAKHWRIDKVLAYVFDDNELDLKIKQLENRINLLEKLSDHLDLHLRIEELEKKGDTMPYGKGTYGSKVGRPKSKKVMKKKPAKKAMKKRR
tara:strand:- start:666 stop:980 length:315 start_codon:yes stop_codon:yes gene_type:complete